MNIKRVFLLVSGGVLLVTGTTKLISATGQARVLNLSDPLLFLTNRQLFTAVGLVELGLAGYLFLGRNQKLQLLFLAWLTTNFAAYRIAMWWGDIAKPCGCLGNAMDWFPWLLKHEQSLMRFLLTFMCLGAYGLLWQEWQAGKAVAGSIDSETPPGKP